LYVPRLRDLLLLKFYDSKLIIHDQLPSWTEINLSGLCAVRHYEHTGAVVLVPWHKDGLESIYVNITLIFVSLWVSLKHFVLLKRRQNLRYTILVCWLASGQVFGLKQVYAVQCVTEPLFWLTRGRAGKWSDSTVELLTGKRTSDRTQTGVCSSVCYNADYWSAISALFLYLYVITPRTSIVLTWLLVPPVLALCIVLWERSLKEGSQTGACTVLDKCDYCSVLGSVFCCILLGAVWKTKYFG